MMDRAIARTPTAEAPPARVSPPAPSVIPPTVGNAAMARMANASAEPANACVIEPGGDAQFARFGPRALSAIKTFLQLTLASTGQHGTGDLAETFAAWDLQESTNQGGPPRTDGYGTLTDESFRLLIDRMRMTGLVSPQDIVRILLDWHKIDWAEGAPIAIIFNPHMDRYPDPDVTWRGETPVLTVGSHWLREYSLSVSDLERAVARATHGPSATGAAASGPELSESQMQQAEGRLAEFRGTQAEAAIRQLTAETSGGEPAGSPVAVARWQASHGHEATGLVDPETAKTMAGKAYYFDPVAAVQLLLPNVGLPATTPVTLDAGEGIRLLPDAGGSLTVAISQELFEREEEREFMRKWAKAIADLVNEHAGASLHPEQSPY